MPLTGWQTFLFLFYLAVCTEASIRGMISGDFGRGRADVFYNGKWGSISNRGWDDNDAAVFCRSLGYRSGTAIPSSEIYNRRRIIWLSNVDCHGTETNLDECTHLGWGNSTEDLSKPASEIIAGVQCFGDPVRISGGESQGRVEIFKNERWGTVAAENWDDKDATVFCSILGYRIGKSTRLPAVPLTVEELNCTGSETSLDQCPTRMSRPDTGWNCTREVAGVVCEGEKVRIVGSRKKGRAEIFYDDRWGTICDSPGNHDAATVFCRMLGFWTGRYLSQAKMMAPPHTPIWAEEFICTGNESTLAQCGYENLKNTTCDHDQDIEVSCSNVQVRISPSHYSLAYAQVFFKGQWLPICSNTMTIPVAQVFCRTLGLRFVEKITRYPDSTNMLYLAHINCSGDEDSIQHCKDIRWTTRCYGERSMVALPSCIGDNVGQSPQPEVGQSPQPEVGQCPQPEVGQSPQPEVGQSPQPEVGQSPQPEVGQCPQHEVIIYHGYKNRSVCADNWDDTDATVYCRMLGFSEGTASKVSSTNNSSDIRMTNINCVGDEFNIYQCPYERRNEHCGVNNVAAANCRGSLVRIVNLPDNENKGRAEIFYDGQWGSICSDYWDKKSATVFCRMLGYRNGVVFDPYDAVPESTGPMWLSDVTCTGNEGSILQCGHTDWADHHCIHEYDTGVECFNE